VSAGAARDSQGSGDQDQTQTPAFRRWFGQSKVVDARDLPLRVYHGSKVRFTEFSKSKIGSKTDAGYLCAGFYFGDRWHAGMYAGMTREAAANAQEDKEWKGEPFIPVGAKSALYPVYLSIEHPLILDELRDPEAPHRTLDRAKHIRDALNLARTATALEVTSAAKAAGFDGVVFRYENKNKASPWPLDTEYVVFDEAQIKSAIGNPGTFDPDNPSFVDGSLDKIDGLECQQHSPRRRP
jgi:hypothetical protein